MAGCRRHVVLHAGALGAAASLDQQGEEQNHMHGKHGKEDILEPAMTAVLQVVLERA